MIRKTITCIFLAPTLKIPREGLIENGYVNAYIKDEEHEIYENAVYLLFKPTNLRKFRDFLDSEYERTKSIIEDYDCGDGYVVVVYKLDEEYKNDFELIKKGKYSETSKKFQKVFPSVVKIMRNGLHKDELSLQVRVFNKTPDLIQFWEEEFGIEFNPEWEVWRGWNEEEETLNIDKIKEDVE